jgi:penicillin-binding protein 2
MVDLPKAIFQSCDTFFYTLAEKLGINTIARYAHELGLGHRTGVDLPGEVSGTIPSEEWKLKNFHQKWYAGETISVGIGQGAVTVTPLQLARAVAGIASDGVMYRPRLVRPEDMPQEFLPQYRQRAEQTGIPDEEKVPIDPANWMIITDAMAGVVTPGMGTAGAAHLQGIDFAGKTGSAQVVSNELKARLGGGKKLNDNGWFAGVVPRRNPEICVVVLLEQGEHGPLAARVASQVIRAYVDKQRTLENNVVKTAETKAPEKPLEAAAVWGENSDAQGNSETNGGNWKVVLEPTKAAVVRTSASTVASQEAHH